MNNKKIILAFIPLLLLAGIAVFIRVIQYEPLTPKVEEAEDTSSRQVPLFAGDPITGDRKARTTIIAFEDFACENCKIQSELLDTVLEQYPQSIKIVWKILPITRYPVDSTLSARYAFCANEQGKFEPFKEYAFQNGTNLSEAVLQNIVTQIELNDTKLEACLASPVAQNHIENTKALARELNVQALPTMFINNKQINIPTTLDGWRVLLEI